MTHTERFLRYALLLAAFAASAALWWPLPAQAARIKEVAQVQGVRTNQLVGYGLVVGLDGTGDQTTSAPFATQSLLALLQQMGVTVPAGTSMQLKNLATVMVTAQLPPFAQPGQTIDVNVSSLANAKSLRGGTLIATPLKGADGQIYALAQGNLIIAGAGAAAAGSKVTINHLSAGRIPEGATVERAVATPLNQGDILELDLNANDFATAREVVRAINARMGEGTAVALDGRVIQVRMPPATDRVAFMADIENLNVAQQIPSAKVVINSRTGSIVMNQAVTLASCAVAHGNLSVTISSTPTVSQPGPLSKGGQTVVTEKADITITQAAGSLIQLAPGVKLADVVKALNSLGATPQDLLAILQAMKSAGALTAELEVILMNRPSVAATGSAGSAVAGANTLSIDALKASAARDPKAAIKETAKQFEAIFMQQLMKSMRDATMSAGMMDNAGTAMGTDMLDAQFASQMTGLPGGLSDAIVKQLERQMGVAAPAAAAAAGAPAAASAVSSGPVSQRQSDFVRTHQESARSAELQSGIPATFMVAQAAHESGWGRHEIRNADGSTAHNLFGIKANAGWKGAVAEVTTTEYIGGEAQKVTARFRSYASYDESFRDYARMLKESPRYAGVAAQAAQAGADAVAGKTFAQGLQRAGYATDPAYADKLSRVINTTLRMQRIVT